MPFKGGDQGEGGAPLGQMTSGLLPQLDTQQDRRNRGSFQNREDQQRMIRCQF